MWEFERIDNESGYNYLEEAYEWYHTTPEILKSSWQFIDEKEEFLRDISQGVNFVGLIHGEFSGMVHGEIKSDSIIEGHLFCPKRSNLDFLLSLIIFSKVKAQEQYPTVLTQVLTKHKTMLDLNQRAGFADTGIRSWTSVYKGKLLEIQHYISR